MELELLGIPKQKINQLINADIYFVRYNLKKLRLWRVIFTIRG